MTQIGGMDVATVLLFLRIEFLMQLSSDGECRLSRRVVVSPRFASSRFILASRWQCYASSSGSTPAARIAARAASPPGFAMAMVGVGMMWLLGLWRTAGNNSGFVWNRGWDQVGLNMNHVVIM